MRFPRFNKKMAVIGFAVGIAAASGGAAFAYFTSAGSSSGSAHVGTITTTSGLAVTAGSPTYRYRVPTGTPPTGLLPSSATSTTPNEVYAVYQWKVTNTTEAHVRLGKVTISIATTGGTILTVATSTAKVTTCKATWFSLALGNTAPTTTHTGALTALSTPTTLAPHSNGPTNHATGTYTVMLVNTPVTNQDFCRGHTPKLLISASST